MRSNELVRKMSRRTRRTELMCECRSHNGFLTAKGLEETALRRSDSLELAGRVAIRYLDSRVSVSASESDKMIFDDHVIDQQYRRFLNGS